MLEVPQPQGGRLDPWLPPCRLAGLEEEEEEELPLLHPGNLALHVAAWVLVCPPVVPLLEAPLVVASAVERLLLLLLQQQQSPI